MILFYVIEALRMVLVLDFKIKILHTSRDKLPFQLNMSKSISNHTNNKPNEWRNGVNEVFGLFHAPIVHDTSRCFIWVRDPKF